MKNRVFYLLMITVIMLSFSVQDMNAQKNKVKLVDATKRIAPAAVMHGKMDKKTKVWQDGDVAITFELSPQIRYEYDKDKDAFCDSIFVNPANIIEDCYNGEKGLRISDCTVKFYLPIESNETQEYTKTVMTFSGTVFSSFSYDYCNNDSIYERYIDDVEKYFDYCVGNIDRRSRSKFLHTSIALLEGELKIYEADKNLDTFIFSPEDSVTVNEFIEYNGYPNYKLIERIKNMPVSYEKFTENTFYKNILNCKDQEELSIRGVARKIDTPKSIYATLDRQQIDDLIIWIDIPGTVNANETPLFSKEGLSIKVELDNIHKAVFKNIILKDSTIIELKKLEYGNNETRYKIISITRPDGDYYIDYGNFKLTSADGCFLEISNSTEPYLYFNGKTIFKGSISQWSKNYKPKPTFAQWLSKDLDDYSNAFYEAKVYDTNGKQIDTIENGKNEAQRNKEKKQAEADAKKHYDEVIRKFGKSWVDYYENGGIPKVGMPEGLLEFYVTVKTGEMQGSNIYRVYKNDLRHYYNVYCQGGKVTAVFSH